ncbi:MAG: hypothetical protein GXY20_09730 [Clostridiales bacterium]|nr:hypothetical protein [Clostridiales bacterium]
MKRTYTLTALILIFAIALTLASCRSGTSPQNSAPPTVSATAAPGAISTAAATADTQSEPAYTYNDYTPAGPVTWNCHRWETAEDRYIISFCEMGLYDFVLSEDKNGYNIIPEMAAGEPVDVTAEYAGDEIYGIPAEATEGYAFKISLNEAARWADGSPVNADTYIYSMRQLLSSEMKNYRADNFWAGTLVLANAEAYYNNDKAGDPVYADITDADYKYAEVADELKFFSMSAANMFFDGYSCRDYYQAGYDDYFLDPRGNDLYVKYAQMEDEDGMIPLTEEAKADLSVIAAAFGDDRPEAYNEFCFYAAGTNPETPWDSVGLKKSGDYEITLICSRQISNFYLKYSLSENWIVYEPLYEAGKSESGGLISTDYGTSADTYMSYGPYKLTEYRDGKSIVMDKNDNWYGYTDGRHEGQYQCTGINTRIIPEQAAALDLFLQGGLDNVLLGAADMDAYRYSEHIAFTPLDYTSKITFNSDYDMLKSRQTDGINKTILSYKDFRHAISLCIDREDFCRQCTATHTAGLGLFNYMYVCDPQTGLLYRDSEPARDALSRLYGVRDADKITGYEPKTAKALFRSAYKAALAAGDIGRDDIVELELLLYGSDEAYVKICGFIQEAVNAAVDGTDLEGRVVIKMTADSSYYDRAREGAFEMIISTWGGSAMDPYAALQCYCQTGWHYEYGFVPERETVTISVNGEDITDTYYNWYREICRGRYASADAGLRCSLLAQMEYAILAEYNTTPIYYRTSASLRSRRIMEGSDKYIRFVGFGGVRFMRFLYSDTEWDAYVAENGGRLFY